MDVGRGLTGGILAPADLDELLDIRDFLRHDERGYWGKIAGVVVVVVAVAIFFTGSLWES